MGFRETVGAHEGRLTPADRRLVETLLADPAAGAYQSAARIGARAGVHASAVVRLARRLGYSGFPALRESLRREVIEDRGTGELVRRRLAGADGDVLRSVIARDRAALDELGFHVEQADIERAAALLRAARRVPVFGEGTAETLVLFMTRRLRRAGVVAERVHPTTRGAAEALTTLRADDVLLAFSFRRPPPLLPGLLGEVAGAGAASVAITDLPGLMLRPRPDVLLAAPRGPEGEAHTLTVPMAIANALLLTLARKGDGRTLDSMDRYAQLRRRLESGVPGAAS
jgi:DNA-binding MurR/RpiR family transcriptional regulator